MKTLNTIFRFLFVLLLVFPCVKREEVTMEEISVDDINSVMLKSADVSLDLEGRYIVLFKENLANPAVETERMLGECSGSRKAMSLSMHSRVFC